MDIQVSLSLRTFRIDLDSGATVSFIRLDLAKLLQINIAVLVEKENDVCAPLSRWRSIDPSSQLIN